MTKRTIDTRFFIHHFTANTESLKEKSRSLMRELEKESAFLPTIVIHELYKEQFETLGRDAAETRLNIIERSAFEILAIDTQIAKEAARLRCKHQNLPTADAVIAASAITTRSFRVVSDDPHFRGIKELRVEWV